MRDVLLGLRNGVYDCLGMPDLMLVHFLAGEVQLVQGFQQVITEQDSDEGGHGCLSDRPTV